jgi:predicted small lipoprotein YifL
MRPVFLLLSLLLGVGACGQKGPLYFRDNPPPGVKPPKTDPYKPVPYPKSQPSEPDRQGAVEK